MKRARSLAIQASAAKATVDRQEEILRRLESIEKMLKASMTEAKPKAKPKAEDHDADAAAS